MIGLLTVLCFLPLFLSDARCKDLIGKYQLGPMLYTDVAYMKVGLEDDDVISHYASNNQKGAYFTHSGAFDVKVAEINTLNSCSQAVLAGNMIAFICGPEIYLLDYLTEIRNNYFKLPLVEKLGKSNATFQLHFASSTASQSSILLVSHAEGFDKAHLTHINAYDSTVTHFPQAFEPISLKNTPEIRYFKTNNYKEVLVTFDCGISQNSDKDYIQINNSSFLITLLDGLGMPLVESSSFLTSVFDPSSAQHNKISILEIAMDTYQDLIIIYIHEELQNIQFASISYKVLSAPQAYDPTFVTPGIIEFPTEEAYLLTLRKVDVIHITGDYVLFFFPDHNKIIVCKYAKKDDLESTRTISKCTNSEPIETSTFKVKESLHLTNFKNTESQVGFLLEVKNRITHETIKSIEFQIDINTNSLIRTTEWYIKGNCHYLRLIDSVPVLVILRGRFLEYYYSSTNQIRVDVKKLFTDFSGNIEVKKISKRMAQK